MATERVKASVLHGEKDLRLVNTITQLHSRSQTDSIDRKNVNFRHPQATKSRSPSSQPASAAPIFTTTTTSATATSSFANLSPSAMSLQAQS